MTRDEFNDYCKSLKSTSNIVQWGDASVWKIGIKVFAIHSGQDDNARTMSFKCSELNFRILTELDGIQRAPYLTQGNWIQITSEKAMNNQDIKDYIKDSYDIIAAKLTKKLKGELGI
jgi:predicted DNA-binding protein (MmcQ/YjbR family)